MPNGSRPSAGLSRGTSSLGVQTRQRRHRGGPRPLPRTPMSLRRTPRLSRLPPAGRMMWGTRDGAPDVLDARGVRDSWDAHRARDAELRRREAERTVSGRPTLPSAPRNGAGRGEAWGFRPRCSPARAAGATITPYGAREKTPPPPPSPLRHSFISLKRRALAPRAWLSRLAALGGGEGERAAPSTYPLRPSGGRGTGRGGFVVCAAPVPQNPTYPT